MDRIVSLLLVLISVSASLAVKSEILSPIRADGVEAAIIIVPGAYIKGSTYKPLAQQLQKSSSLKLWVALLEEFPLNLPNPLQLNGAISSAVSNIKKDGMTTNNVFVAGHSLGGVFVGNYGKSNPVKGILLFGSYLTKGNKLSDYPVPVLTISGDLDGLTRVTRIADSFEELKADAAKSQNAIYRTPVIVMNGVNHGQFSSGTMPSNVLKYDLTPEVDAATAYTMMSVNIDNFLVTALGAPSTATAKARVGLTQAYNNANTLFTPLLNMKSLDVNSRGFSNWTVEAQYIISGFTSQRYVLKVGNQEQSEIPFVESKPEVKTLASTEQITTHTHISNPSNIMDVSTVKSSPDSIDAKLKSSDAVAAALPKTVKPPTGPINKTCMDINKAAWNLAMKTSSQVAVRRYQSRRGRAMLFAPDVAYGTGFQWVASGLKWVETTTSVTVTSTALLTKVDAFPAAFAGMHYCKLLSPYRAMEWIYVDSLRHKAQKSGWIFG
ncbi:uncharacterized protein LOC126823559 [Patella vulgata]|uniref:uncharacterized protein LOC126823559 n=1 Tax=Patella vulgata TaxID=6465 RepID=UPI0021802160|nr:uncharacterized protein LOC126823559 [Patella vulgata]